MKDLDATTAQGWANRITERLKLIAVQGVYEPQTVDAFGWPLRDYTLPWWAVRVYRPDRSFLREFTSHDELDAWFFATEAEQLEAEEHTSLDRQRTEEQATLFKLALQASGCQAEYTVHSHVSRRNRLLGQPTTTYSWVMTVTCRDGSVVRLDSVEEFLRWTAYRVNPSWPL